MSPQTAKINATKELGTAPVSKLLLQYAIPSIIAMTASVLYNLADRIFIGQGVGAMAISALALTLPLLNIAAAFGSLVGIGAASMISIKLGQNDKDSARRFLGNAVMLNVVLGLSLSIVCLIFLDPILYLFGASVDTIGYAREYMRILLYGNVFTHLYMGLNNVLRATGFPRKSMAIMIFSVIVNVVLDAIFIFWFGWGIAGAAWATVIAQFLAAGLQFMHFTNKKYDISFAKGIFRLRKKIISGIISIGMAPFLVNLCSSVVVILINQQLKSYGGDLYIGAYGIVNSITMIFIMIVFGFNQAMQPIAGYNFGAKKYGRVREVLRMTIICGTVVTTLGFIVGVFFPTQAAQIFVDADDALAPQLIAVASHALRIVCIIFPIVGFQVVTSNFFQSIGMAKKAIFLSLTRQLIFLVPLLAILPGVMGSDGVWASIPIADGMATIVTAAVLIRHFRKFRQEPQTIEQP